MKLLNVGAGGNRPQGDHWWNTDTLRTQLAIGTPERANLDAEPRYVEWDLLNGPVPFEYESFDGILLQHVIEHFTCHEAVEVLKKCRALLKPGGVILVSVPDAEYFLQVHDQDTKERAVELFGEPIHDEGFERFFDYALFRYDHKQVLTDVSLMCLMIKAGFNFNTYPDSEPAPLTEMQKQLSRRMFSVELYAIK
jgi:predicted SAM-dependent methyltransferase